MFHTKNVVFYAFLVSIMTYLVFGTCIHPAVPIVGQVLFIGTMWGLVVLAYFNRKKV